MQEIPKAAAPGLTVGDVADETAVPPPAWQAAVGGLVLVVAALMAWGALQVPGEAGYGGVGPNFLPWLCSAVLAVCGLWLIWEARTGGYRHVSDPGGAARAHFSAFAWVSAGMLMNALLIEHIGFVFGCTLCYVLAVQGLRRAAGQALAGSPTGLIKDVVTGLLISAPVFWAFTQFLGINLPGLTGTGWL